MAGTGTRSPEQIAVETDDLATKIGEYPEYRIRPSPNDLSLVQMPTQLDREFLVKLSRQGELPALRRTDCATTPHPRSSSHFPPQ